MVLTFKEGYFEVTLTIPQFFAEIPSAPKADKLYRMMWRNLDNVSVVDDSGRYYDGIPAMYVIEEAVNFSSLSRNIEKVVPGFALKEPHIKSRIRRSLNTNNRAWYRQKEEYKKLTKGRR